MLVSGEDKKYPKHIEHPSKRVQKVQLPGSVCKQSEKKKKKNRINKFFLKKTANIYNAEVNSHSVIKKLSIVKATV